MPLQVRCLIKQTFHVAAAGINLPARDGVDYILHMYTRELLTRALSAECAASFGELRCLSAPFMSLQLELLWR